MIESLIYELGIKTSHKIRSDQKLKSLKASNKSTNLKRCKVSTSQLFELILQNDLAHLFIHIGKLFNRIGQQLVVLHDTHEMALTLFQIVPQLDICILYVSVSDHELAAAYLLLGFLLSEPLDLVAGFDHGDVQATCLLVLVFVVGQAVLDARFEH